MSEKNIKKCPTLIIIKKMQIKSNFIFGIHNSQNSEINCISGYSGLGGKGFTFSLLMRGQIFSSIVEIHELFLRNLGICLYQDPAIAHLDMHPKDSISYHR